MNIEELMKEYEAEVTVVTKLRCRTATTNYTGAHKLFKAGLFDISEVLCVDRTVENVRLVDKE